MTIWNRINKILEKQDKILKEMTSMATNMSGKGGKKPTQAIGTGIASPGGQRQIDEMIPSEKGNTLMMQNMNSTLNTVQDTMLKLQELITNNHTELKADISKLDDKIENIQAAIKKNENRINVIEERTEQNERKIEKIDQRAIEVNKELETSLIHLEMDRAAFYLRIQNIPESKEEDLGEEMAMLISEILQEDKDNIRREIDEVYRLQTSYARRYQLPREVHIRFARKTTRDNVYLATRGGTLTYKSKEINVLKQIPRKVRELRRDYKELAAILNKKKISFRWIIPEGMMVSIEGRRTRIDNIEKAQEIRSQLLNLEEEIEREERAERSRRGERQEEREERKEKRREEEEENQRTERVKTRTQTAAEANK